MPAFLLALFGGIGSLFASLASLFALYVTKKIAVGLAAIAMILALTAAFWAALQGLIGGISASVPAELSIAASWVIPGNASACFSAYIAANVLRFAYDMKTRGVQMRML